MAFADKSRTFPKNPAVSLELLARGIEQFLIQREDMICQILSTPVGISIQTKKKDEWKKYILQDNSLQINISEMGECVSVQVGGAKWVAKGAAMGVGMIVAWPIGAPLMALSSIGGFGAMSMPKKILAFVERFLMTNGQCIHIPPEGSAAQYQGGYPGQSPGFASQPYGQAAFNPQYARPAATEREQTNCPSCQALIASGVKFCPECGASAAPKKTVCPVCNAEFDGRPNFCEECGGKLDGAV